MQQPRSEGKNILKVLGTVILTLAMAGCGSGVDTIPIKGVVTVKGQPAPENTRINFIPVVGGQEASGIIDANGAYEVFSGIEGHPGIMAGKYKVFFTPDASSEDYMNTAGRNGAPGTSTGPFPKEYTAEATTPLEKDVTSETTSIDFDIP